VTRAVLPAALALLLVTPTLRGDSIIFTNGDRISGKIVAMGTKRIKLRTPYGRLEVPRTEIQRLVWDDGREEVLNAPPEPRPPKTTPDLVLLLSGHTFWQAWDPDFAPADPSLRLRVSLDDQEVVSYTDVNLDPRDLPGALVNSFVFASGRLFVRPGEGVQVAPPDPAGGKMRLALELPEELVGERRLELAYQVNDGTTTYPEWRDVVQAGVRVDLTPEAPAQVRLEQDRGLMEYERKSMRHVETFRAVADVVPFTP
jgi:hypothetical protein